MLGQSVLEYWLTELACSGINQVLILADDRPEQISAMAGTGARWGLAAKVVAESSELSPAQALLKYEQELDPATAQNGIVVLDHFPGLSQLPLYQSYSRWFSALHHWMPRAKTPDRIGVREARPGVWTGLHCHISPEAQLHAPCWIGKNAFIGKEAVVGPGTIIEDGAFIEPKAAVTASYVGPDTFVGQYAAISNSIALGNRLINWQTGASTSVADTFLLCALRRPQWSHANGWLGRMADLYSRNKEEAQMLWKHLLLGKQG
jgi:NDP-sugar pyrophosphorylase family protein